MRLKSGTKSYVQSYSKSLIICFRSWRLMLILWVLGFSSGVEQVVDPNGCRSAMSLRDHQGIQGALASQHRDGRQRIGRRAHLGGDDDLRHDTWRMDHFQSQGTNYGKYGPHCRQSIAKIYIYIYIYYLYIIIYIYMCVCVCYYI